MASRTTSDCGFPIRGVADPLGTPSIVTRVVGTRAAFCGTPPDAAQPGGAALDIAAAGFNAQPVYRNGSLWVADTVGVSVPSGDVSAIRWLQIDVAAWPDEVAVVQDAFFGAEGVSHVAPAIAVDATSNLSIVYVRSGATELASAWVTGRRATDPPNTLRPGLRVGAGVAPLSLVDPAGRSRGPDFLGAALDPVDGSAWLIVLYAEASGRIGSRVAQIRVAASPTLSVALERAAFRSGETLRLTATLTPAGLPTLVDAYVLARLPDGSFFSLLQGGALVPGIVLIMTRFEPFAFNGEILRIVVTGGDPIGDYAWLAALTYPGTLTVIGARPLPSSSTGSSRGGMVPSWGRGWERNVSGRRGIAVVRIAARRPPRARGRARPCARGGRAPTGAPRGRGPAPAWPPWCTASGRT